MNPRIIVSVLETAPATHDAALTRAVSLARWHAAELHVVDVGPPRGHGEHDAGTSAGTRDARIARARRAADAEGVAITSATLRGDPVHAIADYAARVEADVVVAGTEPRRGDGYWSAGSFAAALGTAASASTIAVSSDVPPTMSALAPFRSIVAAVDFSDASARALSAAVSLVRAGGAHLTVLHVLEYPVDFTYAGAWALAVIEDLDARVAGIREDLWSLVASDLADRVDVEVSTVSATPADVIVDAAAAARADLVVLGLPRRRRLDPLVAGSTAHAVVRRAASPVLLVPGPVTAPALTPVPARRGLAHRLAVAGWGRALAAMSALRPPEL